MRVLHSLSFIDDPTRILRAIRYEQRYDFTLGQRTRQLLIAALPMIERISGDRVRHEIDKILTEKKALQILDRLQELGILEVIHPDLVWDDWIKDHIADIKSTPPEWRLGPGFKGFPLNQVLAYAVWLIRLPANRARKVTKRLRVSSTIAETVQSACSLWVDLPSMAGTKPSIFTARLDKVSTVAIYSLYCACDDYDIKTKILTYITEWQYVTQKTTGYDLEARRLPPGPIYKEILTRLRNAWLDGEVLTTEDEKALLENLMGEISDR